MSSNNISLIEKLVLTLVVVVIAIGFALFFFNIPLFNQFVIEDGVVEWLTVAGLFFACLVCFSRFFKLIDLKEPEALNAFYAGDKFDLGKGRIGVTIMTDVAPEFIGPDGELKTVNFIVYDKEGKILLEKTVFKFYNVFELTEYSWGELDKELMVYKYYYNYSVDEKGREIIDRGKEMQPLNSLE